MCKKEIKPESAQKKKKSSKQKTLMIPLLYPLPYTNNSVNHSTNYGNDNTISIHTLIDSYWINIMSQTIPNKDYL